MTPISSHWLPRATLVFAVCLCLAGAGLLHRASSLAPVTDPQAFAQLNATAPPSGATAATRQSFKTEWFAARDALLTPKWPLHDRGLALIALSLSALVAIALLQATGIGRVTPLQTPKNRAVLVMLGPITLLLTAAATLAQWGEWQARGLDPAWADSPVAEMAFALLAVIATPLIALAAWLATRGKVLPVGLWRRHAHASQTASRPGRIAALIWAALGLLAVAVLILEVMRGHYLLVPVGFLWLYFLACARAVLSAPAA